MQLLKHIIDIAASPNVLNSGGFYVKCIHSLLVLLKDSFIRDVCSMQHLKDGQDEI